MKKTNKNTNMGMLMGMCFGISIGTALGTVFDNISIGTSLGMCVGMVIGVIIGAQKDKEVNKQLKEKGYTIQAIEQNKVIIVNKWGEESVVIVPKGQMDEEAFVIGDVVYLDDDGLIEQAYDKEDE